MGKNPTQYVAKAIPGVGWRIWNRKQKKWWGNYFNEYPQHVLDELNTAKDADRLIDLTKKSYPKSRRPG